MIIGKVVSFVQAVLATAGITCSDLLLTSNNIIRSVRTRLEVSSLRLVELYTILNMSLKEKLRICSYKTPVSSYISRCFTSWFIISHSMPQKFVLFDACVVSAKHAGFELPEWIGEVSLGQVSDIASTRHINL
jgi:hypothetical protein